MTLKDAMSYLLENGYLLVIENQVVVTRKLTDSLNLKQTTIPSVVTEASGTMIAPAPVKKTTKKVVTHTEKRLKEIWDKFVLDADIPWRVSTPSGDTYTVRQFGPTAAKKLAEIIDTENVDYDILTKSTRNYYQNTTYKSTLFNYFLKDIWKEEYSEFLKSGPSRERDGGNQFED